MARQTKADKSYQAHLKESRKRAGKSQQIVSRTQKDRKVWATQLRNEAERILVRAQAMVKAAEVLEKED